MQNVRMVQNEEDLAGLVQADNPSAVMFYADWCPDCRRFKPTFATLADEYGKRISFLAVDVARLPELEQRYDIGMIPTVLLFQGGKLSRTWEFVEDIEAYRKHFDRISTRRA
jgi:thiol-disulfide isomerase/thioredoxin